MQGLGLSDSTPRTEGRLRALFWPAIRNDGDFDYVTRQSCWVCFLAGASSLAFGALSGAVWSGLFEFSFFFLAGFGVRQRSVAAGIAAFAAYLLDALVIQRYTGNGFGVVRVIFLALLLANLRGTWVSARWKGNLDGPPVRLSATFFDRLVDQWPSTVWPKGKWLFYLLAAVEILGLFLALLLPIRR